MARIAFVGEEHPFMQTEKVIYVSPDAEKVAEAASRIYDCENFGDKLFVRNEDKEAVTSFLDSSHCGYTISRKDLRNMRPGMSWDELPELALHVIVQVCPLTLTVY